ncbi:MAG: NapC/NirT family cytochrome c [Planctomycetota bacterium]
MDFLGRDDEVRKTGGPDSGPAGKAASDGSAPEKAAEETSATAAEKKAPEKPATKPAGKKPRPGGGGLASWLRSRLSGLLSGLRSRLGSRFGRLLTWAKSKVPETRRGKIIFYSIAGLLTVSMLGGGVVGVWSSFPSFCKSCHHITPYYESWQTSVHGKEHVACTDCHFKPGAWPYIKGKINGAVEVFKYASHSYGPKLRSEVQDISCLRPGCHARDKLDKERKGRKFKSVRFVHADHFQPLRGGIELRCASCHSQSLHTESGTVSAGVCFSCHLAPLGKDATPEALADFKRTSDCKTCHEVPKEVATGGGFKFDHGKYAKEGSGCASCHSHVTHGRGPVPERQCELCHNEGTAAEREEFAHKGADGVAEVHGIHVHETQVECFECHDQILHGPGARAIAAAQSCDACHDASHVVTRALYEGSGLRRAVAASAAQAGGAVKGEADPMAASGVRCEGCHKGEKRGRLASAVCTPCHEKEFDRLGTRWKSAFDVYVTKLDAARLQAESLGLAGAASKQALDEAKREIDFVRDGRGVHNVKLAVDRLRAAQTGLARLLEASGAADAAKVLPAYEKGAARCLDRCHVGVETVGNLKYAEKDMPHGAHVASPKVACSECHEMAPEKHKKTLADVARNCATCHHKGVTVGEGGCASCHPHQEMVYRGKFAGEAKPHPFAMAKGKVQCLDCHVGIAKGHSRKQVRDACAKCHKLAAFSRMLDEWQVGTREAAAELEAIVARAKDVLVAGAVSRERQTAVRAARERALAALELVKSDGSAGAHNLEYLNEALSKARKVLLSAME